MGMYRVDEPPTIELCADGIKLICLSDGDRYVFHLSRHDFGRAVEYGRKLLQADELFGQIERGGVAILGHATARRD